MFTNIDDCNDDVCDVNAVPTLIVLIIASVRKDTLKMDSLVNVD